MTTVDSLEARNRLSKSVERAARGDEIVITCAWCAGRTAVACTCCGCAGPGAQMGGPDPQEPRRAGLSLRGVQSRRDQGRAAR